MPHLIDKLNPLETSQAEALKKVVELFAQTTEFNTRELKAISILSEDRIFRELLQVYLDNKKHIKRKFTKELLELAKIIGFSINEEKRSKILRRVK